MIDHPATGTWRAWLDEEVGERPAVDLVAHLRTCATCRQVVLELQDARDHTAQALTLVAGPRPSVAAKQLARQRLQAARQAAAQPQPEPVRPVARVQLSAPIPPKESRLVTFSHTMASRWRITASGLAAAFALTFFVGTPVGRAAAEQFLSQFRSQRFTVISVDPAKTGGTGPLAHFQELGTLTGSAPKSPSDVKTQDVATLADASKAVGFTVKQPDTSTLPAGVATTPKIRVSSGNETRFTFDKAKSAAYFASINRPDLSLPDKLNGVSLVVSVPTAVLLQYSATNGDGPGVLVGEAKELVVSVDGNATLDEVRDFLLSLPGVPPEVASQLRNIQDWQNTLPIPVPADKVGWQQTTIAGGQGLLLADNSGIGSGAIWQHDGQVYGVAGQLKSAEIQRIANSLR
jgi:hypothetical protein